MTTDPQRWARLRAALEHALELASADRDDYLAEVFAGEERLLQEARELLAADVSEETDLEPPSNLFEDSAGELNQRVGPYRLRRRIGSGGMGTVYLAVRADGSFRQRVAVKRLHGGDGPEIYTRFQRERQVLANLEHPLIARLIDGGVDEDGAPYLVMEYVEGLRIDDFCDEGRLDLVERLRLFRQVCSAVGFAHRNLVVHRDLKPGNILVTADGLPKLLDFGVAKVLDPEKRADDPEFTLAGIHAFTPAYASPEQVRGRPVTTTSDVYSLGVLLYHLLVGRMPYDMETTSMGEMARAVCEIDADIPSVAALSAPRSGGARAASASELADRRAATPRQLARALRGDLDNIIAKALRKEPGRRYETVEQLSDDIRRHLEGLPVRARPDTLVYRSSRFVRRHRIPVAAAAVGLVSLVAGLVVLRDLYRDADRARAAERAERELAQERAVELGRVARDLEEQRQLATERAEELEQQREVARSHLEDVHAFATKLVFDVHREVHPLQGAERAKELVLELGLQHLDKVAEAAEPSDQLLRELAAGYLRLGELQGDPTAPNLGDVELAQETLGKAVAFAERAAENAPDDPRNAFALAQSLLKMGDIERALGKWGSGTQRHRRGLELARQFESSETTQVGLVYVLHLLYDRNYLASLEQHDLAGARKFLSDAERCFERAVAMFPALESGRTNLHIARADLLIAEGDLTSALDERAKAIQLAQSLATQRQSDAIRAASVKAILVQYAGELTRAGEYSMAREVLTPVLEYHRELPDETLASHLESGPRAQVFRTAAYLELRAGDPTAALELARSAVDAAKLALDGAPSSIERGMALARCQRVVALALRDLGQLTAARDELVRARDWFNSVVLDQNAPPDARVEEAIVVADLAQVSWLQAKALDPESPWRGELEAEAREWLASSLEILSKGRDPASVATVRALRRLEAELDAAQ